MFSVNGPLLKTLRLLFLNPGKLFREYLSGKRKTYYKPVAFFIIITVIHILIRNLIEFDALENVKVQKREGFDTTLTVAAGKFMFQNVNNFLFVFVGTMALMLKLFFYKRYFLAEYVAVSFYMVAAYTIIGTFNAFFMKFVDNSIQYLAIIAMLIYYCIALVSYFKKPAFWIVVKGIFSYVFATILYMIIAYGISFLIVWSRS